MSDPGVLVTLSLIDTALRGGLIAMLLLFAAVLLRDRAQSPPARVGIALALGLCVQAFSSAPLFEAQAPLLWQAPLIGVSTANSMLFWLFARALFDDDFGARPAHAALWLVVAGLGALNCGLWPTDPGSLVRTVSRLLRWMPLLFALLAIAAAVAHWRGDLVERRRRARLFIVAAGSAYTLAQLLARLGAQQGRLSAPVALLDVLALTALAGFVVWHLLRLAGTELFPAAPQPAEDGDLGDPGAAGAESLSVPSAPSASSTPSAPSTPSASTKPAAADAADQRLAQALQVAMAQGRAYRAESLSIAGLAAQLDVPEYRLRRVINQQLGYRNFNAFINRWRLDEARAALADPARRALPVLSIALEAGFQSIGPFNRAFKTSTGLTPTEFRKQKLTDS